MDHGFEQNTAVQAYLDKIASGVRKVLGRDLIGLYLHGSAVQLDFRPQTSDLDILGVVSGELSETRRADLASQLSHEAMAVPAAGLELILCSTDALRSPTFDFRFEFALSTGLHWPTMCEPPGTASDILINIALCLQSGLNLLGPPAVQVFEPVSRNLLCEALIEELQWHQRNLLEQTSGPIRENAVLNAARSLHVAETGQILSKSAGGRWWLQRYPSDSLVVQALARRDDERTAALDTGRVSNFLTQVVDLIENLKS